MDSLKKIFSDKIGKAMFVFVILSFIIAILVTVQRHGIESSNRTVEITADYYALYEFAQSHNLDFYEMLSDFQDRGLSSVAFSEDTIETLSRSGIIRYFNGLAVKSELSEDVLHHIGKIEPEQTYLLVYSEDVLNQLKKFSFSSYTDLKVLFEPQELSIEEPAVVKIFMTRSSGDNLGIGFSIKKIQECKKLGLGIVLRPGNNPNMNPESIRKFFSILKNECFADKIIFAGSDNDVTGFPSYLDYTVSVLKELSLPFGIMEAPNVKAMQKGIKTLGLKAPELAVRVMTIVPVQQKKLSIESMAEKYSLGVRERNIRLIFIRPHTVLYGNLNASEVNMEYITAVKNAVTSNGMNIGMSKPFPKTDYPNVYAFIISLGIASAFVLCCRKVFKRQKFDYMILGLWALFSVLCLISGKMLIYRKLSAFMAGIIFPFIAVTFNFELIRKIIEKDLNIVKSWLKSSLVLVISAFIASVGGIFLSSLLAGTEFYVQADMFRGIKILMVFCPIFATLLWTLDIENPFEDIKKKLDSFVKYSHALAVGILGGIGSYFILRTGNASESSVSKTELSIRSTLMALIGIRPRFKEFMLGYPAIMCFGLLRFLGLEKYSWILILCMSIGIADVTDTFAHIHTPILITLIRVFNGTLLGWGIGSIILFVAYFIFSNFFQKKSKIEKD